jgi:hypothetical protein
MYFIICIGIYSSNNIVLFTENCFGSYQSNIATEQRKDLDKYETLKSGYLISEACSFFWFSMEKVTE